MKLGFIGLGHLGKAIAGRLLDCGHSLTVLEMVKIIERRKNGLLEQS